MQEAFERKQRETQKIETQRVTHDRKITRRLWKSLLRELHPDNSMFSDIPAPDLAEEKKKKKRDLDLNR